MTLAAPGPIEIRQARGARLRVTASLIAQARARDHDGRVRRRFALYATATGFACERIDDPGMLDERCFGALADTALAVYEFFGTEPLANYLYGLARLAVPGLSGRVACGYFPAEDERDREPHRHCTDR